MVSNALFHLPNLKEISVELYGWNPLGLEKLVSSSPSLQDLSFSFLFVVRDDYHTLNLSSPTLKRLEMSLIANMAVLINATNLEYLSVDVRGLQGKLPYRVSFVNPPTRLHASSLCVKNEYDVDGVFTPCSNLFSVISDVTALTIIGRMKAIPPMEPIIFQHLTRLKFTVSSRTYVEEVDVFSELALLQQCPVLEVVIFDMTNCQSDGRIWTWPDSTPQCLVTSLKSIEIVARSSADQFHDSLLDLLNYLLGIARVLELLKIDITPHPYRESYSSDKVRSDELHLINKLFDLLRSSPHCSFEFFGIHQRVIKSAPSMASMMHC